MFSRALQRTARLALRPAQRSSSRFTQIASVRSFHMTARRMDDAEPAAAAAEESGDAGAKPVMEVSAKVQSIVDQVCELSILETVELVDVLKVKFNYVETAVVAAAPGAGGGAAAPAEEEEPVVEQTAFTVKLDSFDDKAKIKVIKEVRGITGLGLKQSKELVEALPATLKADLSKEEAEKLVEAIAAVGGQCSLK